MSVHPLESPVQRRAGRPVRPGAHRAERPVDARLLGTLPSLARRRAAHLLAGWVRPARSR